MTPSKTTTVSAKPVSRKPAKHDACINTVALVSLGCPKNLVDSEKMLGLLAEEGLVLVNDESQADAIVINTCGFLEASKDESLGEIKQAAQRKREGTCKRLVVAGCLVQRHRAKMLEWCPDIDALIGVFDRDRIVQAVRPAQLTSKSKKANKAEVLPLPVYSSIAGNAVVARRERDLTTSQAPGYFESDAARLRLTPRHYAYLRISEGCNQNCAFCTIPSIRGKMRSKPTEALHRELRELLADGTFEFNLIGQDTTSYGHDIGYHGDGQGLAGMLRGLDALLREQGGDAPGWLRLMYAYPSCFTDEMIDAIAQSPTVVKYIDMPLQHISDPVLTAMRRHTSRKLIETLLEKLHKRIPGIAVRTTFIAGFPGETDDQHRELVDLIRNAPGAGGGFAAAGVFPYSPEPGTPAGTMHARGQGLPAEVVEERVRALYEAQQAVVFARHEKMAKAQTEFEVLIDSVKPGESKSKSVSADDAGESRVPTQGRLYVGRTYQQAPQIDGVTYVVTKQKLVPGELVRCRVTDFDGYDLIAQPVDDLQKRTSLHVLR